jgi:hypothetical protein
MEWQKMESIMNTIFKKYSINGYVHKNNIKIILLDYLKEWLGDHVQFSLIEKQFNEASIIYGLDSDGVLTRDEFCDLANYISEK